MPPPFNQGPTASEQAQNLLQLYEAMAVQALLQHASSLSNFTLDLGNPSAIHFFEHHFDNVPPGGWFGGPGTQGPDPIPINIPPITSGSGTGYFIDRSNTPIVKGGSLLPGTNDSNAEGPNNCTGDQDEQLKEALKTAQSKLNEGLSKLSDMLEGCDDTGLMSQLIDCLNAEGDPNYLPIAFSHMICGTLPTGMEGNTDWNTGTYNQITFDLNQISTDAGHRGFSFSDLLARDMLHELVHNCSKSGGFADPADFPVVEELDVQIITNILGFSNFPKNPPGIAGNVVNLQISPSQSRITTFRSTTLNLVNTPGWLYGNYFGWDPSSGQIECNGKSLVYTLHKY